jgi:hypothetical protein
MLNKLEDKMMTAIDNVSFIRHDGQLHDDYNGYAKATAKVAEEYASQQTAEKDREINHLKDSYQTLDNYFDETKQRLQKELSDFKALVKQISSKKHRIQKIRRSWLTSETQNEVIILERELTDLETQVDKYLQE